MAVNKCVELEGALNENDFVAATQLNQEVTCCKIPLQGISLTCDIPFSAYSSWDGNLTEARNWRNLGRSNPYTFTLHFYSSFIRSHQIEEMVFLLFLKIT